MKKKLKRFWLWFYHRPLSSVDRDSMDAWGSSMTTEYEVFNRRGESIGYWAYGSWDPNGFYQGE